MFASLEPHLFYNFVGLWIAIQGKRLPAPDKRACCLVPPVNHRKDGITLVGSISLDVIPAATPAPVLRDVTVDVRSGGLWHIVRRERCIDQWRSRSGARCEEQTNRRCQIVRDAHHLTKHKISDRARERAWPLAGGTSYTKATHQSGARFAASATTYLTDRRGTGK
jgi:hypothetical protein